MGAGLVSVFFVRWLVCEWLQQYCCLLWGGRNLVNLFSFKDFLKILSCLLCLTELCWKMERFNLGGIFFGIALLLNYEAECYFLFAWSRWVGWCLGKLSRQIYQQFNRATGFHSSLFPSIKQSKPPSFKPLPIMWDLCCCLLHVENPTINCKGLKVIELLAWLLKRLSWKYFVLKEKFM